MEALRISSDWMTQFCDMAAQQEVERFYAASVIFRAPRELLPDVWRADGNSRNRRPVKPRERRQLFVEGLCNDALPDSRNPFPIIVFRIARIQQVSESVL